MWFIAQGNSKRIFIFFKDSHFLKGSSFFGSSGTLSQGRARTGTISTPGTGKSPQSVKKMGWVHDPPSSNNEPWWWKWKLRKPGGRINMNLTCSNFVSSQEYSVRTTQLALCQVVCDQLSIPQVRTRFLLSQTDFPTLFTHGHHKRIWKQGQLIKNCCIMCCRSLTWSPAWCSPGCVGDRQGCNSPSDQRLQSSIFSKW